MKKTLYILAFLFALQATAQNDTINVPTKRVVENAEQIINKISTVTGVNRIPASAIKDLPSATLKKTSRDSIANLTQAQLLALGTRFVTDTVADLVSGDSSIPVGFVSPRAYGAVMDGVTDDRDALVAALAANDKIWIDSDMFLDLSGNNNKSIFLDDNTYLEGSYSGIKIFTNNLVNNAFIIPLATDVTIKNLNFIWDGTYDASFNYSTVGENSTAALINIENYLTLNKAINLVSSDPIWRGPITFMYQFLILGSENITFENVTIKAKGETADRFIVGGIKLKEEWSKNQTVNANVGQTTIPKNITLNNVTFDGTLMGIQGIVDGFSTENLKSYRYSDVQNANGTNIGGVNYWMPPPHLIDLNADSSTQYQTENVRILNTIDYGEYVGSINVRPTVSGYCNSLKLTDTHDNPYIKNYISYRRDGLADFQNINNGYFEDLYAESTSAIFDAVTNTFPSLRFLGSLNDCIFNNITLIDKSATSILAPLNTPVGNNNYFNNLNIYVNNLTAMQRTPFGISGSNNKFENVSFNIKSHTDLTTFNSIILSNTRSTDANNYYDITLNGWRNVNSNANNLKPRILFSDKNNPNNNYLKIVDSKNNFTIEQVNEIETSTWTRSYLINLSTLNITGTSYEVPIPNGVQSGWNIKSISTVLNTALDAGVTASVTSGTTPILIADIGTSTNSIRTSNFDEITPTDSRIFLRTTSGTFNATGVVKVTVTLVRRILN